MKQIVAGIVAHVDAGKTTLSEALLYRTGEIRKLGRVDHGDAFLDTNSLEKARGITIFAHQALVEHGDLRLTLLDTPGHVDFAAETERVLRVLDYAILVVSGTDGVQGHTETLWRLLARYGVPTFIFVNKCDAAGFDREAILAQLRKRLSDAIYPLPAMEQSTEGSAVPLDALRRGYCHPGRGGDERLSGTWRAVRGQIAIDDRRARAVPRIFRLGIETRRSRGIPGRAGDVHPRT